MTTTKNLKCSVIIAAAGSGKRAGFGRNKLLEQLAGAPVLYHTLKKFDVPEIDEVIVTSSERDFREISALCAPFGYKTVLGGATRTESVKRALEQVTGDIVLVHDGARPFLSHGLILRCIDSVEKFSSGVCAVPFTDTAALADDGKITGRIDRNSLYRLQTPQGFFTKDLRLAYGLSGNREYTDDSAVYGEFIAAPHIVEGEETNVKLTYKSDFGSTAPALATPQTDAKDCRVGYGTDVHAFGDGDFVTLCGEKIPCNRGLVAHSDGDVPVHALMDALLSAAGLKDIGNYFPDTDPTYSGADSLTLLGRVVALISEKGWSIVNISLTIQAEKPRLKEHIDAMVKNLSLITKVAAQDIAIAAGTNERLGFVGEELGICATAAVFIKHDR